MLVGTALLSPSWVPCCQKAFCTNLAQCKFSGTAVFKGQNPWTPELKGRIETLLSKDEALSLSTPSFLKPWQPQKKKPDNRVHI